jgi:hypothetical protein
MMVSFRWSAVRRTRTSRKAVERQQEERIRHHLAGVKKARLNELLREGIITDDVHCEVRRLIDSELAAAPSEHSRSKSESRDETT